jgi:hypothetical protein
MLQDLFGRVAEDLPQLLEGLDLKAMHWQPDPGANPIGWLAWHIGRCEDAQMAEVAGTEQIWTSRDWVDRFGLSFGADDIGYGHSADQVRHFHLENPALLTGYYADVHDQTSAILDDLTADDLDRIIDRRWDPPVSIGVRIASVLNDVTQHLGQLAYVRGLWVRSTR